MLLAKAGLSVLILEKSAVSKDTLSTHMVHESGIARLGRWEPRLRRKIRASNCPPITSSTTDLSAFTYDARHWPIDGNAEAYCPRRTVLDPLLLDAAVRAGCSVRTDFAVEDVVWDDGRVVGVRGKRGRSAVNRARALRGRWPTAGARAWPGR